MKIILTPEAYKQYTKLSEIEQKKIKKKLKILEEDAFSGKKLAGILSELRSLRAWPYRIIYFINESQETVYIVSVAHRQGVYK
ncbi:hypothetical protein BH09PAT2_BH09PAT2_05790 [soil metagenome]